MKKQYLRLNGIRQKVDMFKHLRAHYILLKITRFLIERQMSLFTLFIFLEIVHLKN